MANEQQGQDAAWNDFLEAKRRLLQSMLDFIQAAEKAFEGHVWITLGYPEGMKGWAAYCKDNFGQQATIMRQLPKSDRRQLLLEEVGRIQRPDRRPDLRRQRVDRPPGNSRRRKTKEGGPMRKAVNIICGILAEVCALAVILLGAYLAYDAKASGLDQSYVSHRQEQVSHRKIHKAAPGKTATMRHTDPPAETEPGDGELFAYLRVPSWGKQFRLPIWQGTAKTVLDKMGGGHYDTTAMPGQTGNSSYAGHNTYADMADIRLLKPGDVVYIETGSYWYRYRINSNPEIVDQSRTDVIDQDAAGVERGLTLQTCWPIMTGGNVTHRLIVHGGLDGWAPKTDGTPAEYTETTDTTIDKISRRIVTVSEKKNLPVTGVLGICAFIIWILLDTIGWMCSHRRMTCYWHGRDIGGPITWLWRLNAGIMPSNTIVFIITRTIVFLMMWTAIILSLWRWACPPLASMHFLTS